MENIRQAIADAQERGRIERLEYEAKQRRYEHESSIRQREREEFLASACRPASKRDYLAWLEGYTKVGGKVLVYENVHTHCNLYFMAGFRLVGSAPVFSDLMED